MPSNKLSRRSFDTLAPVICHPPPWPPFLPPPPLAMAKFFCFATVKATPPHIPMCFAQSCTLSYVPAHSRWEGASSHDIYAERIMATLEHYPLQPSYHLRVVFAQAGIYGNIIDWRSQHFPIERPYVGERLTKSLYNGTDEATASCREIPV